MRKILSLVRRCVEDYDMIKPGDHIAVGVSGGKDSLVLLMALAQLREFYPVPYTVEAITLDMGHADGREGMDPGGQLDAIHQSVIPVDILRAHQIPGQQQVAVFLPAHVFSRTGFRPTSWLQRCPYGTHHTLSVPASWLSSADMLWARWVAI